MKEFSYRERKFIVEHQDNVSLGTMAKKFNCNWHEVYNCYAAIIKTDAYADYTRRKRESVCGGESSFRKHINYIESEKR